MFELYLKTKLDIYSEDMRDLLLHLHRDDDPADVLADVQTPIDHAMIFDDISKLVKFIP